MIDRAGNEPPSDVAGAGVAAGGGRVTAVVQWRP